MKKLLLTFLATMMATLIWSQVTVSGTVTDESGEPLIGASILAKGTTVGTITDIDGMYSLSVPSDATVLVISFTGFQSVEEEIAGRSVVDVSLGEGQLLDEVVVLGYTSRGKNQLTGNAVQVKSEDITKVPMVSVDQALQGKVPGLNISQSSGTPGSNQDIRIRGVGSITASNAPLYVIDGVPMISSNFNNDGDEAEDNAYSTLNTLATLNANDIESITVLKDAASTAAYGARGSNGVIVITTKSGRSDKPSINFSTSYGMQNQAVTGPKALTGAQREELFYDALFNTYGTQFGFDRAGTQQFYEDNVASFGPAYLNWNNDGRKEGGWDELVKNADAPLQTFDLSASGSDEKSNYFVSVGYNSTEAVVVGSEFERFTGRLRYGRDFTDKLRFNVNLSASNTRQNAFLEQSAYFANPHLTKYFMPPTIQAYNDDGTLNTNLGTSLFNTLYLAENDEITNDLVRGMVMSSLEYEIIDNLKAKTQISFDANVTDYRVFNNRIHGGGADVNGSADGTYMRNKNMVWQNSLNYKHYMDKHIFDITALQEFQTNSFYILNAGGENIPANGLTYVSNTSANQYAASEGRDWKNASYLGMLNYSYDGKYIVDLTYRREGSSRFPTGRRFGDFYAIGAAWNIDQEDFFNVDFFDQLRVRGSFGLSGNSGIEVNTYQSLLALDADYNSNGAGYPAGFGSPNLSWEKNQTIDLGLDFEMWNRRISGSVAYYDKSTFDLLQEVPLSLTTGFPDVNLNLGEMRNNGIEAQLNVDVVSTKDLVVGIGGNIATVANNVEQLAQDANGNDITITTGTRRIEVGRPIYSWYMRGWAGVDSDNGNPLWYVNGTDGETTSDYNSAQVAFQGKSAIPTFTGGLNANVNFKGVFASADFFFAGGHKVFEDWARYTNSNGLFSTLFFNGSEALMNRWQQPGDVTDVPAMQANAGDGNLAAFTSSRFLYDGDYIRLRNVTLGYTLPSNILKNTFINGATFSIRGTNLLTWVKDDRLKYDPEVRADGFTQLTTPPIKSVVFALNLKF